MYIKRSRTISYTLKLVILRNRLSYNPYGIAVDTAKAVDTAVVLQFYFMSTAKMQ
jgi:hypothetical protein